ncbi:MAG: hypothetical protein ING25_00070 [Burkholderiales bacterium]|nr:hypothetical protein [Burkholderiales bacterium]
MNAFFLCRVDKPDPAPDGGELDEAEEARRELERDVFTRNHNQRWRDILSTPAA